MTQVIMGHGVSGCFGTSPQTFGVTKLTCGLRNSVNPTSGNLTPQETTKQVAHDMGPDGARLSCPGSSVVANSEGEAARVENAPAPETIGRNPLLSVQSQSLTDKSEADETPIKPHRA